MEDKGEFERKVSWEICNKEEFDKAHLSIDDGLLIINLKDIPENFTVMEYIELIQQTGIVIKNG